MKKIIKGASMPEAELSAYKVGIMRLKEIGFNINRFNEQEITIIGMCSLNKRRCEIGKIGQEWFINLENKRASDSKFKAYYVIIGKKMIVLHPMNSFKEWQERDNSPRFADLKAGELFARMQSPKSMNECIRNKKGRGPHTRIGEKVTYEKRFYGIKH